MDRKKSSQISGFYKKTPQERQESVKAWAELSPEAIDSLNTGGLNQEQAQHLIENVVGSYQLPMGIATNFLINGKDYLIPMVIEEPSVIAAVSNAAKLFRAGGGFITASDEPIMIGQIQILDVQDIEKAVQAIEQERPKLLDEVNKISGSIGKQGGGAVDIETHIHLNTSVGTMLIIHLLYDTRDAMGANAINTAVKHLTPAIEAITGGRVNLRILSNLADRRKACAEGKIPAEVT